MNEWNLFFDETATESGEDVLLMAPAEEVEEAPVSCTCTTATTAAPTEPAEMKLIFEPGNFLTNMKHMGLGMVTIFMIIGIIIGATALINKVFSKN